VSVRSHMWQRMCHCASKHQLSLKVGSDLWWIVSVIKMWQKPCQWASSAAMFYRQVYCH